MTVQIKMPEKGIREETQEALATELMKQKLETIKQQKMNQQFAKQIMEIKKQIIGGAEDGKN